MRKIGLLDSWNFKFQLLQHVFHSCSEFGQLPAEDQLSLRKVLSNPLEYRKFRGGRLFNPNGSGSVPENTASWIGALSEAARHFFYLIEGIIYLDKHEAGICASVA
jgi:hypothetical protein